ncbi:rho GTPase-activating protein 23 isoform X2 [Dipodomys merriami]|uniref:rho GTPase-activating protein 23 isoform X2 n=1 Tax=Dipodomys merriami TaxID=94247 RepID=UPI00385593FA
MVPEPISALPSDPRSPATWSDPGPRVLPATRAHLDNSSLGMSHSRPSPGAFPHLSSEPRTPRAFPEPGNRVLPSRLECQQALSHWLSNQVPRRLGERRCPAMPPRARSASQDRLEDVTAHRPWPCSTSQDALSQLGQEGWHRARSDDYLSRATRSAEALGPGALVSPRLERCGWASQRPSARTSACPPRDLPGSQAPPPSGLQGLDDIGYIGYRSYSPSFQRRTGLLHALSFRDSPFGGLPTFNLAQSPAPFPPEASEPPRVVRPEASTRATDPPTEDRRDEVVLRQKPPTGRKVQLTPARQMNLGFSDESSEPEATGRGERLGKKVAPLANTEDSLASIPFIDEPTSPSIDLQAKHVPASAVVSSAMNSAPVLGTSPSSPTFTFALGRHYSQDCSSIKTGRRSSYLLAITTERSKSCDDGLNTFRDEGRVLRRLPNRVPSLRMLRSFFTDGSLDSWGTSEDADAPSKRHSTSDLSDATFSDIRREGWLYYKQILTKKGKKAGSGLRQWKRVYAALRARSLSLSKERREPGPAVGAAAAGAGEDEAAPVCIGSCLVDISYSETKRRHVFRLTTADFCEYLFQAEDRDDMLGWIRAIRENSRAEGEDPGCANQALISKKLNDYRKVSHSSGPKADSSPKGSRGLGGLKSEFLKQSAARGLRTQEQPAGNKDDTVAAPKTPWGINIIKKNKKVTPRAFGIRLEECQPATENQRVPLIVAACCRIVEARGLESTGIYRVPGNNAVVSSLQEQLNRGPGDINLQDERWQDLNVISSLLKSFFRKLPEPLFTDDKYNDFIEANRIEDSRERMKTLRKLIRDLPGHYYETLKFLVGHLKTIADHSEKNKMEPRNLALVFGPTLVRTSEDNMTDMVTHMPDRYKIVETLIQHSDWFFSDDEDKGERTPVDDKETQSVPNIEYLLPNIGRTGPPGDPGSDSTTCSSAKSKGSWAPKKEPYTREMLAISFISAVNRKRKKRREARGLGSSTDDDSEQEAHKPGAAAAAGTPGAPEQPDEPRPGPAVPTAPGRLSPSAAPEERPAADTRSIVSGYSTLSTMDRSVCSGAEGRRAGAGDEADDERSELSLVETDTEGGAGPGARLGRRPSFSSHHLIPCDTLARRRLSRSRPDADGAGVGRGGPRAPEPPGSASSSSQESLRPATAAAAAALGARPSRLEALRLRLRGTADDMLAVRLRRPLSPETRRRRSSWRRHTVVVQSPLTDLNFNEWKELGGGGAPEPPGARALSDNKDSGLSSLESTKARASAASLPPGDPSALQGQAPRRQAASRLHQCL